MGTKKCDAPTEVYARVCGFFRPVQQWNKGKKEEFGDRVEYRQYNGEGLSQGAAEIAAPGANTEGEK